MDQKQHVFPKFLLKGFASDNIVDMYDRDKRFRVPVSITRATAIGSFYTLPEGISIDSFEIEAALNVLAEVPGVRDSIIEIRGTQAYLKPGAIEAFLGVFESRARPSISRLASDGPPPSTGGRAQERFDIASLMGLQLVRGQTFREQMDDVMREVARTQILASPDEIVRRWRKQEVSGKPPVVDPVEHLLDALEGMRLAQINKLGEMLPMAFEQLAPRLFARTWKVLRYDHPNVITSDEGIGMWMRPSTPRHVVPGVATADAIYFPIDAKHVLQMTNSSMPEDLVEGGESKLRHSNDALAASAHRWILAHPDCTSIGNVARKPRSMLRRQDMRMAAEYFGNDQSIIQFFRDLIE